MDKQYKHRFDLEERTIKFSTDILFFCKSLQINYLNKNQIDQLIKSSTSIGANYMEGNNSSSKKDFRSKISICKKEAKETTYWLRLLASIIPEKKDQLRKLWSEAQELLLIFSAILRNQ